MELQFLIYWVAILSNALVARLKCFDTSNKRFPKKSNKKRLLITGIEPTDIRSKDESLIHLATDTSMQKCDKIF